jgi:hypothetical protein
MLSALNDSGAEYLVVGAHAMATYGPARATGDFDIWVRPTKENAQKVWEALERFGAPRRRLKIEDLYAPGNVYQIGVAPNRIDILTSIDGVEFDEAWQNRKLTQINGIAISVIGREQLLKNKRAVCAPRAWRTPRGSRNGPNDESVISILAALADHCHNRVGSAHCNGCQSFQGADWNCSGRDVAIGARKLVASVRGGVQGTRKTENDCAS